MVGMSRADWVALAEVYDRSAARYDEMARMIPAVDAKKRMTKYAANERRKAENLRANAA